MEENYLPSTRYLQKKFYEWFSNPVSADPPIPVAKDLQKKFYEWFSEPVSPDPPFPAEANYLIGDPVPANSLLPVKAYDSHDKTRSRRVYDLRKLIIAFKNLLMQAEIQYLSIGLFIGIYATHLLLTGMVIPPRVVAILPAESTTATPSAYASTPVLTSTSTTRPPASTYTPTPTLIRPTSTATATPTFSDTLTWLLQDGYLSQAGPLELRDQLRLYESSLKFISISTKKNQLIGEQINGQGYGSPSNICGPLSISILQETGIVNPDLDPHDFWLLNPDDSNDRKLLAKAFPPEKFGNYRIRVKLDEIDWNLTPLFPGDFIYIYAGNGGNFEHMLVVNRVDSQRRAYAVTNYNTENGFIISEVLLYDPNRSDVGIFSVWTAWPKARLGSTGFGGFEVWRLRAP